MTEEQYEKGTKIRCTYMGVLIEGYVAELWRRGYEYLLLQGEVGSTIVVFTLSTSHVTDVEVLELPPPQDTWPVGTVVKYMVDSYPTTAVKRINGRWYSTGGSVLGWAALLGYRPLTVLAESTVIS